MIPTLCRPTAAPPPTRSTSAALRLALGGYGPGCGPVDAMVPLSIINHGSSPSCDNRTERCPFPAVPGDRYAASLCFQGAPTWYMPRPVNLRSGAAAAH
ncbi:hypothetical protein MSL71_13690 [Desulfoluna butyratoxydans]|uniref:Uncharacterized protein n=1 Tax=Desulfoluna butyratoxydans TaxID=231438 RepID=A0A4V6YUC6_9BACT|nr:hypothetical protein MSL71_13690 [Desulfoluna butyratoxydans]